MLRGHLDFEYNRTKEQKFNLVCCHFTVIKKKEVIHNKSYWLNDDPEVRKELKADLKKFREKSNAYLVCFNASAEASSLLSLGLDPTSFQWYDLQIVWKLLTNHFDPYRYGWQIIKGKKVFTSNPKINGNKYKKNKNCSKPEPNLVAFTYKMLEVERDSEHKTAMRDLIISCPESFSEQEKIDIMKYCEEDVAYLEELFQKSYSRLKKLVDSLDWTQDDVVKNISNLSMFNVRTAIMERIGYPVNVEQVTRFSKNVAKILKELCEDINAQNLPIIPFSWDKRNYRFKMNQKELKEYYSEKYPETDWLQTDKGAHSLSLEAFEKHYKFRHDYPRDNLGAQMVRYLKTKQSLNGFVPKGKTAKDKTTFTDFIGSDGRVRAFLNPFGAQSSRSQPGATGFIPLKAAWVRSLISAPKGYAICGIDWGSQEFLISAIVSGCKNMWEAYKSGDVYLHSAKLAGAVPLDGKKEDYKEIRNLFKSTVLGITYNMQSYSLSKKLTQDTGKEVTEEEAQKFIDQYYNAYPEFKEWNERNLENYYTRGIPLTTPDNWVMFCDNYNPKSVNNFPIQGAGASIMRKAVEYAQDKHKLKLIYTLHDALYIEFPSDKLFKVDSLYDCMKQAFIDVWKEDWQREWASSIRQDIDVWSLDYIDNPIGDKTPEGRPMKVQTVYIDERSKAEYERFSKYF